MLKARAILLIGFVAITLFFGLALAKEAASIADHVNGQMKQVQATYP